jgi:uncharacterized protein (TIGR01777 family)
VGHVLCRHFHAAGHEVTVLSRQARQEPWPVVEWDGRTLGRWVEALDGADVCINLAGRSVNCRYTERNREEIYRSRIDSTRVLGEAIASVARAPRVWLNASTATIYRHALDRAMDEATGELGGDEPGAPSQWNFSIHVAKDWEAAFFAAATPRTRKVAMRSAIIMSPDRGSPFALLLRLARFGLGGRNGSGRQFVSWVHDGDFARAVEWLIAHEEVEGVVNIAAPHPLRNAEFMRELRRACRQPVGLPAPAWAIEVAALFLRTESELVLKSRRVGAGRLMGAGFTFQFPVWAEAARDLVARWRRAAEKR